MLIMGVLLIKGVDRVIVKNRLSLLPMQVMHVNLIKNCNFITTNLWTNRNKKRRRGVWRKLKKIDYVLGSVICLGTNTYKGTLHECLHCYGAAVEPVR